jgi:dUTP pyrophosphatase
MKLNCIKLHPEAVLPTYAHDGDAGLDMRCVDAAMSDDWKCIFYYTGIAVEIPNGYVGLLFPRSSVYKTGLFLANSVGVIDSGYRGEIKFVYRFDPEDKTCYYGIGDKVGQLVIVPCLKVEPVTAMSLSVTDRDDQGFGSSGR